MRLPFNKKRVLYYLLLTFLERYGNVNSWHKSAGSLQYRKEK